MTSNQIQMFTMIDVEIARLQAIRECCVSRDMLPSISVLVEFLRLLGVTVINDRGNAHKEDL